MHCIPFAMRRSTAASMMRASRFINRIPASEQSIFSIGAWRALRASSRRAASLRLANTALLSRLSERAAIAACSVVALNAVKSSELGLLAGEARDVVCVALQLGAAKVIGQRDVHTDKVELDHLVAIHGHLQSRGSWDVLGWAIEVDHVSYGWM